MAATATTISQEQETVAGNLSAHPEHGRSDEAIAISGKELFEGWDHRPTDAATSFRSDTALQIPIAAS